jgi:Asp-tRNA(Asn)/Glu-tRNA(Gln) amidotransferase A subunit family amidase
VADVALLWSALCGSSAPEARLDGLTVGLLRRAPDLGDGRETEESDAAEAWVADLERLGARVVESGIPPAQADLWPLFLHEAAWSHRETFPSRADEYASTIRPKLEAAQLVSADAVATAREALAVWRAYEPEVDLYMCPCYAVELPAEDADELEVRLPLSSFLRWVNLIGWAGLAVGNMQFVAPDDRTVLAAGLAWEGR